MRRKQRKSAWKQRKSALKQQKITIRKMPVLILLGKEAELSLPTLHHVETFVRIT